MVQRRPRSLGLRSIFQANRAHGGSQEVWDLGAAHSFEYSHAIKCDGNLWVIHSTNKEDIEVSAYPIEGFGSPK